MTIEVQKIGQAMMKAGCSSLTKEMIKKGMVLCRSLSEPAAEMNDLLSGLGEDVSEKTVLDVLRRAKQPVEELESFFLELSALNTAVKKRAKAEAAAA